MRLISELITERDMLDFSQGFNVQRSYTGSRLFPDRKTQYIEAEYTRLSENGNLPTVAMIHGFDTEAHIGSRVPFERVTTESLLIKEKINLSERLRRITRGLDMQMDSVRRYVFDDVARTAKRLGAEPLVVYRRTRERAPAHQFEIEEAIEEGVHMKWLSTIAHADEGEIRIEKMKLDESGRPVPTGEFETVSADSVVLALGQETNLKFLEGIDDLQMENGSVVVDGSMMTGCPGIFAGGDMVPGERNVTVAIGHGKRAARSIDAWLAGRPMPAAEERQPATFGRLNTWYYADAPKSVRPQLDLVRRQTTFDEVVQGLTEQTALFEARRCMSCGNCFECDNCYGVCPDNAIIKLGPGKKFRINYEYCKGCGICANECPCGAIDMVPESI